MKNITNTQKREMLKKYPSSMKPIKVVDFQSACKKSEQLFVENYRKSLNHKQFIYRATSLKSNIYEYKYAQKAYKMTRESQRKFCSTMKNKYGSVRNYWSLRR